MSGDRAGFGVWDRVDRLCAGCGVMMRAVVNSRYRCDACSAARRRELGKKLKEKSRLNPKKRGSNGRA